MNNAISIIRIAILLALTLFATVLLFGEEQGDGAGFLLQVVFDKALAFAAFWCVGRLYKRWSKTDPLLSAYNKAGDDGMDNPNPMHVKE